MNMSKFMLRNALLIVFFCNSIFAGHDSGSGGGVMVNYHTHETPQVKLLDLWEAEKLKQLTVNYFDDSPIREQIGRAFKKLEDAYHSIDIPELRIQDNSDFGLDGDSLKLALKLYSDVENRGIGLLLPGIGIVPPQDVYSNFFEEGWKLEGVARYDDDYDVLNLNRTLYSKMNSTNRAALFVHEAVYKVLRTRFSVQDSVVARNVTACAFSEEFCNELPGNFQDSCRPCVTYAAHDISAF